MLRKNAAEALKKEQEEKAKLRQEMIEKRCGKPKSREGMGESELRSLCQEYQNKICTIESDKYDLEKEVEFKDYQINELNIAVNDLRGKFIKPSLKKVSKYENKFAKLQKKAGEFNLRSQLKNVKKKEFTMDQEEPGVSYILQKVDLTNFSSWGSLKIICLTHNFKSSVLPLLSKKSQSKAVYI